MSQYLVLAFNNIGKNTNLLEFSYESKETAYYYQVHCTTKMYLLVSEGVKFTVFFSFNYIYWHHSKLIDFFCLTVSHFKRVFAIMKCIYLIGTWTKLFFTVTRVIATYYTFIFYQISMLFIIKIVIYLTVLVQHTPPFPPAASREKYINVP